MVLRRNVRPPWMHRLRGLSGPVIASLGYVFVVPVLLGEHRTPPPECTVQEGGRATRVALVLVHGGQAVQQLARLHRAFWSCSLARRRLQVVSRFAIRCLRRRISCRSSWMVIWRLRISLVRSSMFFAPG